MRFDPGARLRCARPSPYQDRVRRRAADRRRTGRLLWRSRQQRSLVDPDDHHSLTLQKGLGP